jgi:halocyanin-like protein
VNDAAVGRCFLPGELSASFNTAPAEATGMEENGIGRRGFVTAIATAAGATAATEPATAQREVPAFGSYLNDANLYEDGQVNDFRGEEVPTLSVGAGPNGLSFEPPTIWIDPGTTVDWEWTGEGGAHNVNNFEGPGGLDSGDPVAEAGTTYEYEFTEEDAGITLYRCIPHEPQGMKGAIAVGDDVDTVEVGGDEGPSIEIPGGAFALLVLVFLTLGSVLGLGYFFQKFGGDYEGEE